MSSPLSLRVRISYKVTVKLPCYRTTMLSSESDPKVNPADEIEDEAGRLLCF